MKFSPASPEDIEVVVCWIDSKDACIQWAGPAVTYPIDTARLKKEIDYSTSNSFIYSNTSNGNTDCIVGFGQLLRIGQHRYHLARVTIAPHQQGTGHGRAFCQKLIELAQKRGGKQVSLNVFRTNHAALNVYRRIGFSVIEEQSNSTTFFMVKELPDLI